MARLQPVQACWLEVWLGPPLAPKGLADFLFERSASPSWQRSSPQPRKIFWLKHLPPFLASRPLKWISWATAPP